MCVRPHHASGLRSNCKAFKMLRLARSAVCSVLRVWRTATRTGVWLPSVCVVPGPTVLPDAHILLNILRDDHRSFFDVLVLLTPALAHARLAVRSQGLLVFALVLCNSESAGGRSAMGGLLDNCYFSSGSSRGPADFNFGGGILRDTVDASIRGCRCPWTWIAYMYFNRPCRHSLTLHALFFFFCKP